MLLQRFLGVAAHRLCEGMFVPASRNSQIHPGPTQSGQPKGEFSGIGRQARHQHFAGHRIAGLVWRTAEFGLLAINLVAVKLGQELFNQPGLIGVTGISGLLDDPSPLTANPAAAHMEHLHRGLQLVVCESHHVGVGTVA